jgi:hypothetical protein
MSGRKSDEQYSPEETARRRDEVIRRMANTPPQPHIKSPIRRPKKKKSTAVDRPSGKAGGDKTA